MTMRKSVVSTLSTAVTMALFVVAARSGVADGPSQSKGPSALGDAATPAQPPREGLTWGSGGHNSQTGTDHVSCYGLPYPEGTTGCNPYFGDTRCTTRLPILCLRVDGSQRPNYDTPGMWTDWASWGWAGGRIALSAPVLGTQVDSLSTANAICEQSLGAGYRMAEFHDGKFVDGMATKGIHGDAWPPPEQLKPGRVAFHAYGDLPRGTRFWVHINSQPANCWDKPVDPATTGTLLEARELAVMQACLRKAEMVKKGRCAAIIDPTLSEGIDVANALATRQLNRQLHAQWPEYCPSDTFEPVSGRFDLITRVRFKDAGHASTYLGDSFFTGCAATASSHGRWKARLWFNEP